MKDMLINILERIIALILLVLLTPLFLVISILVVIDLKSSPIFRQIRMGRYSNPFTIYKFRTLKADAPDNMPTDSITDYTEYSSKFGLFLRASSLDEIPQLINIVKGDMSFVGPRPLMINEEYINKKRGELGIYSIRPGITGLPQINGRDLLKDDEKIKYDLIYLSKKSLLFDIYIICKTLTKVLKRENIKI